MADTNQDRLLTELLRDISAADAYADAAGLEPRVLAAWDESAGRPEMVRTVRLKPATTYETSTYGAFTHGRSRYVKVVCGVAAAVALAVWLPGSKEPEPVTHTEIRVPSVEPGLELPARHLEPRQRPAVGPTAHATRPEPRTFPPARTTDTTYAESSAAETPMDFIPLMPMTGHELSGSFQIVRVQMPRASLGALASPLEHPDEVVEADVLLGEDGMARAIRVSANQSGYPWRSR